MKNNVDLHTHSILSKHAYSSVTENIDEAIKKDLKVLGVLEHQYDEVGVGAHYFAIGNLEVLPRKIGDLHILRGVELNILENGKIDISRVSINKMDYTIASMHRYVYSTDHTIEENTNAYIEACKLDYVSILGHIDRNGYPCDYKKVVEACVDTGTIIEMNNSSLNKEGTGAIYKRDLEILKYCKEYNCPVIINSDSHIRYDVGKFELSLKAIDEAEFPHHLVLNFNEELFKKYFSLG